MKVLEKYEIKEEGYHPFLIKDGWQVAQLNWHDKQDIEYISRIDLHNNTDEVFLLLKGKAVLITAIITNNKVHFELELMQPGVTYNVPAKTWHNIAMQKGCEVIIVEKNNTHMFDFEFFELSVNMRNELIEKVNELYNKVLK